MFSARLGVYPKDATDSPWPTYLQHFRRSTVDHQKPANPNCSPPHSGGPDRNIRRSIPLLGDCRKMTVRLNLNRSWAGAAKGAADCGQYREAARITAGATQPVVRAPSNACQ